MARIPLEPIETAPWGAIPFEAGESSAPANEEALREALAPLKLGSYDERVLANLVLEASTTVAVFCSLLARKDAAARADERRKTAEEIAEAIEAVGEKDKEFHYRAGMSMAAYIARQIGEARG